MDLLLESITINYTSIITILVIIGLIIVERLDRKLRSKSEKTLANNIDVTIKPVQSNIDVSNTDCDNQLNGKN